MKKIFLTMACLCVVLFVFSACAAESGDSGSDSKSSESEQTVYYTLTLNANGGEGSTVYNNIKANQKFVLENARALGVTRKNYSFVGWARTSYAENASYEDGGTVVVNSNITLYAVWKKNSGTKTDTNKEDDTPKKVTYTVMFDSNGGTSIAPKTVNSGDRVSEPDAPVKIGNTFAGWYSDSDFYTKYNFRNVVGDNITLYAKWNLIEYSIEYELNGGEWEADYNVSESFTVEDCFVLPDAEKLSKPGFGFTGWHEKSDLTDSAILQIQKGTTENKKYYASWEEGVVNYTVRHFKQNISKDGYEEVYDDAQVLTGKTNSQTEATALSYEGFTPEEFSQVEIKADGTSEVSIYYSRNSYTVTFDTNGGSEIPAKTVVYGDSLGDYLIPERKGYYFVGWYSDPNFCTQYFFFEEVTDNITIYTKWGDGVTLYTVRHFKQNLSRTGYDEEVYSKQLLMGQTNSQTAAVAFSYEGFTPEEFSQVEINGDGTTEVCIYYKRNSYTVTFDTNGGSEIPAKSAIYEDCVSEPNIPKKAGCTFGGWYLDSDFYVKYDFGNAVTDNIVLYARWDVVEYSIGYELNGGSWNSDYTEQTCYTVEDSFVLPDAEKLSKQGYGFTGWHERDDLNDDAILQIAKGATGNKKYYASWEAGVVNYTVRHFKQNVRRNDYDEVIDDAQVLTGKTNTQTSATALSYEGFTPYEVSQETIKADGTSVVNIYYIRNSYTVTFETNGGSDIPDKTIIYGQPVTEPTAPTKAGFAFNGWYTSSNFSSLYTFGNTISDNITLYAKWQNTAGIAVSVSPNSTVSITKTETDDTITLTATSGHSSYNWKIDDSAASSFDGASVNENTLTISKAKLVAGYRYQISLYAPKGGIPYSAQIAVTKGE